MLVCVHLCMKLMSFCESRGGGCVWFAHGHGYCITHVLAACSMYIICSFWGVHWTCGVWSSGSQDSGENWPKGLEGPALRQGTSEGHCHKWSEQFQEEGFSPPMINP
jgi:hypothetical protein